ncbi:hypothetical protein [Adonisia turfae]|uniref:Uncharacterized protein n=1 Tax=Adonisia turfae CCMR0081 TaxID=2292702 RepID=A0A6M0RSQ3_9CYAN|nr:hypothetical protein [Adonisia turfae]NEZ59268.1 hypothetical protein [Adonisia turfae CCMR0081]
MPKAQIVLRQLLQYGLPAIALSAAGSLSFILLSGNTYVFDMFNNWFNTNIFHLPDESQPLDKPVPDFRPDSQIPNITIELPTVSVDPDITVTTPVTVDPRMIFSPELQFNPELNPEITASPTIEVYPELNTNFDVAPSLEVTPQVTVPPYFRNSPERPIILTNPDRPSIKGPGPLPEGPEPIPIDATVPDAPRQSPEPIVPTVPGNPIQLPTPKTLPKTPVLWQQPYPAAVESEKKPDEPEFNFQFPEDEVETTPETPIISFDPEELPPDLSPQPRLGKEFLPEGRDIPPTSARSRPPHHPTDPSDKVVSVPEPGMVMIILFFGLGLLEFKKKR